MSGPTLALAIDQIQFARDYTLQLLEDVRDEEWFAQPQGVTHLAWQMGHLAMAQYALTLLRIRGKLTEDRELMSNQFFRLFQKGTEPNSDPQAYPPVSEIRATLDAVHAQALKEMPAYDPAVLAESLPAPYALTPTKLGSLYFCSAHEMLHAGQIGLVRRLLGKAPLR